MTAKIRLLSLLKSSPSPAPPSRDGSGAREAYDVIVIGGGVRAIAIAQACAASGAAVALFAPGEVAAAPDERAWPVLRANPSDRLRSASDTSAASLLRRAAREFSGPAGVERAGAVTLAAAPGEREALTEAARRLKAEGVEAWMVPGREVAALSPPLAGAGEPGAGLYEPGALTVDADAVALGLCEAAARHGADMFSSSPVTAIVRDGAETRGVEIDGRLAAARAIVLADDFAAIRLIREGKGRLSLTRDERTALVTAAGAPSTGPALAAGDLMVSRDRAGALTAYGPRGGDALARRLVALAPALAGFEVVAQEEVTAWTGVDGRPQIGAAEIPSVWLALGFGRDALSLALPAAECIAAQIAGRPGPRAFEPFAPTRRVGVRTLEAAQ